jgi:AcrR family transcriptional regulator
VTSTQSATSGSRATEREQKTVEILVAVWRVVAAQGLGAVSFRSVAKEAGVSPGRVQHYFGSKEELIRASVELMISSAEDLHREATDEGDPADELWQLLTHAIPQAAASPAGTSVFYSFVAASVADPGVARILADAKHGVRDEIAALLHTLRARRGAPGSPSAIPVDRAAQELLAMSDGVTLGVLIGNLTPDQARATLRGALDRLLGA